MGTTEIGDFFRKVYELSIASDMNIIITTGAQVKDMETIDGKVYVEPFIDGNIVIEECEGSSSTWASGGHRCEDKGCIQ